MVDDLHNLLTRVRQLAPEVSPELVRLADLARAELAERSAPAAEDSPAQPLRLAFTVQPESGAAASGAAPCSSDEDEDGRVALHGRHGPHQSIKRQPS